MAFDFSYRELLKEGENRLIAAGIKEAVADAWILFSGTTGFSKTDYLLRGTEKASSDTEKIFLDKISRRLNSEPVQYIEGSTSFMGYNFYVNENVLIPRFDTEVLVDAVFKVVKRIDSDRIRILDMCTGSGCIAESLYLLAKEKEINLSVAASDISEAALEVAKFNAKRLGAEIIFYQGNLFENILDKYDIIVSNPPYIRTDVITTLDEEVKGHEPVIALDGYEDGLFFYRQIISQAGKHLESGGHVFFEIGCDQGEDVKRMLTEHGFRSVKVIKDLSGLDRVVTAIYTIY